MLEDSDKKLEVLGEAVEKGYAPALMNTGQIYEELYNKSRSTRQQSTPMENFLQKAREYYQKAGERGIPKAYIELGKTYVGDIVLHDDSCALQEKFYSLSPEIIDRAASFFKEAGEAHHPRGWDYLFQLYLNLYRQAEAETQKAAHNPEWDRKQDLYEGLLWESLGKGLALGSQYAYHNAYHLYRGAFEELCKKYGSAPQDKIFRETMEKFIFPSNLD